MEGSLSAYWEEQSRIMSPRPRGRGLRETERAAKAQPMLPKPLPAAAPEPEPAGQGLEELRAKAERVGAWLLATDTTHERWAEGAAVYSRLQEQMQALEDGPYHYLRQPGDEYTGIVIIPADYQGPLLGGTWQRLEDGRIEARLSLFQLRVMLEARAMLESTESEQ